jgi:hypothetical protein
MNELQTKRRFALISDILWREWDPLSAKSIGAPRHEYDMYVSKIDQLLMTSATSELIAEHLLQIEVRRMLIPSCQLTIDRCKKAAELLVKLAF